MKIYHPATLGRKPEKRVEILIPKNCTFFLEQVCVVLATVVLLVVGFYGTMKLEVRCQCYKIILPGSKKTLLKC
jgi:hypothetical protein